MSPAGSGPRAVVRVPLAKLPVCAVPHQPHTSPADPVPPWSLVTSHVGPRPLGQDPRTRGSATNSANRPLPAQRSGTPIGSTTVLRRPRSSTDPVPAIAGPPWVALPLGVVLPPTTCAAGPVPCGSGARELQIPRRRSCSPKFRVAVGAPFPVAYRCAAGGASRFSAVVLQSFPHSLPTCAVPRGVLQFPPRLSFPVVPPGRLACAPCLLTLHVGCRRFSAAR